MNHDWNFEPNEDECERCIDDENDECWCGEPDTEVYDE